MLRIPAKLLSRACLILLGNVAAAQLFAAEQSEQPRRPSEAIQDNSFLIEEAYNQEAGVVQHILNITADRNFIRGKSERSLSAVFTQEWPVFSQAHLFSYTVPYTFANDGNAWQNGLEDLLLNYRFQLSSEGLTRPAIAPRFSLILPTGDEDKGFGNGRLGYQFNLPISKVVSDRWTLHANAGATFFPDVRGNDLQSCNLGVSAIYAATPTFNLLVEAVANWDEEVDDAGKTDRNLSAVISPGFRYAWNLENGAQWVVGAAVPIGLTRDTPDYSVFLYVSFEHSFLRQTAAK